MFFKPKPATPDAPIHRAAPPSGWKHETGPTQTFWVVVETWDFKVFPELRGSGQPRFLFQFEGTIRSGDPLVGAAAVGEVQIITLEDTAGGWPDYWTTRVEYAQGLASFVEGDPALRPLVGLTLFVNEKTLDWVFRAFTVGNLSREGGLNVEVTIDCPDADGDDFWAERWRERKWRVTHFGLLAGSRTSKV